MGRGSELLPVQLYYFIIFISGLIIYEYLYIISREREELPLKKSQREASQETVGMYPVHL